MATGGRFDQLALSPLACFWGLIAAFSEAINTVLPGKLFKKYGPIPVIGAAMLVAGNAFLPIYFTQPMPKLAPVDVWVIVYIIIGGTLLAYTMYLSSVQYIGTKYGRDAWSPRATDCNDPVSFTASCGLWPNGHAWWLFNYCCYIHAANA